MESLTVKSKEELGSVQRIPLFKHGVSKAVLSFFCLLTLLTLHIWCADPSQYKLPPPHLWPNVEKTKHQAQNQVHE